MRANPSRHVIRVDWTASRIARQIRPPKPHGSTLLNITQQIASSVGVAIMSVLLTNHLQASKLAGPAMASLDIPALAEKLPAAAIAKGLEEAANAFAETYWVAWVMVLLTVIPAMFLPRKREDPPARRPAGASTRRALTAA